MRVERETEGKDMDTAGGGEGELHTTFPIRRMIAEHSKISNVNTHTTNDALCKNGESILKKRERVQTEGKGVAVTPHNQYI